MTPVTVTAAAVQWAGALDELEAQLDRMASVTSLDELIVLHTEAVDLAVLGPLPAELATRARALGRRLAILQAELAQARDALAGELAALNRPARATASPEPAHLDEWG